MITLRAAAHAHKAAVKAARVARNDLNAVIVAAHDNGAAPADIATDAGVRPKRATRRGREPGDLAITSIGDDIQIIDADDRTIRITTSDDRSAIVRVPAGPNAHTRAMMRCDLSPLHGVHCSYEELVDNAWVPLHDAPYTAPTAKGTR